MAKKRNQKTKRQDQQIGELTNRINALSWVLKIVIDLIAGMLHQSNQDIANLEFKDEQQYGTELLQLLTMKRLLSIIQMSINTAATNLLGDEKSA